MEITFSDPNSLYFLLGIPLLIIAYVYNLKYKKKAALKFSNFEAVARVFKSASIFTSNILAFSISLLIFVCLVFAASGMTLWYFGKSSEVGFVLAIDASASMTADDFMPNRLEAAKEAAKLFIDSLPRDAKVAVLSFSGTSFVEQQLTDNFGDAKKSIDDIQMKDIAGTDIANAIITSANLVISETRPKSIVVLTDGRSTVGVPVEIAADYAKGQHITVYAIGIGTETGGKFAGSEAISTIDESSLIELALGTNGKYYGASDKSKLADAYSEIAEERKQYIGVKLGSLLLLMILSLLVLQWILSFTKYNNLP